MKICVHHYYTYELFWYLFHASTPLQEIPTWFTSNRYNKNNHVGEDVSIKVLYFDTEFEIIFCSDRHWNDMDSYHLWDYTIYQIEKKNQSNRGWNSNYGKDLENEIIPRFNKLNSNVRKKTSLFLIDWEYGVPGQSIYINNKLNKEIKIFKDELIDISDSQMISFTHVLWSFIFPNTINLREYYFFSDYLKYKNDYKYKINYPVRRITKEKYNIIKKIDSLNNPNINCTVSSFTNYYKIGEDLKEFLLEDSLNCIGQKNLINKRGYNINDWGGEFNDDNMKEFMYKLLTISEINLIHEQSTGYNINEKSFSHILANKPFIPTSKGTYHFYNEIFKTYGYEESKPPMPDLKIYEKIDYLSELTKDEKNWGIFLQKVSESVSELREKLLDIMNTRNGYLDFLIKLKNTKKDLL